MINQGMNGVNNPRPTFIQRYSFVMRDGAGIAWRTDEGEYIRASHADMAAKIGLKPDSYAKGVIELSDRMVRVVITSTDPLSTDEVDYLRSIAGDRPFLIQLAGTGRYA